MLKDIFQNLPQLFRTSKEEDEPPRKHNEVLFSFLEEIKSDFKKLKGINKIAIFSKEGFLLAQSEINKPSSLFDLKRISPIIVELQNLDEYYDSKEIFNYLALRQHKIFIKKLQNPDCFLVIIGDKQVPLGTVISYLNGLEVK